MMGSVIHTLPRKQLRSSKQYQLLSNDSMKQYFSQGLFKKIPSDRFKLFSIIAQDDQDRIQFSNMFKMMQQNKVFDVQFLGLDLKVSRSVGCLMGLAICDALGASTEFMPFNKSGYGFIQKGFPDIQQAIKQQYLDTRAGKVGIWTDDCSMALCMADSLLYYNYAFKPIHMRYLFIVWIENGLNNGGRPHSIGLGGNISISMQEFGKNQTEYCITGDRFNNGNGSLMRLAPIPIAFQNQVQKAVQYSAKSSLTTHNGEEAQECCKLLARIIVNLINRKQDQDWKVVLQQTCNKFQTKCQNVQYLSKSLPQPEDFYQSQCKRYGKKFKHYNQVLKDRDWDWKSPDYTYSPTREADKPGYVGSYCMDALAMALHTVWHTKSFKECAMLNANMGGDCDTVGAIAGQIAGAIYGLQNEMFELYRQMDDFKSGRYEIFLKGFKLANKKHI